MLVEKCNDNRYRVTLRSYNPYLMSKVDIECEDYEVFKKIIDVVKPILSEEDNQKEDN